MTIDADAITKQMQSAFTYEESLQIAFDAFMLPEVRQAYIRWILNADPNPAVLENDLVDFFQTLK